MKNAICAFVGMVGGLIAEAFGGWDNPLQTLVIFMAIDYISGLLVAALFKRSDKSEDGGLESRAGWKGLCRKGMTLFIVLIAYRLDILIGGSYIRNATIIAFVANEALSIVENAGLMGLPLPKVITDAISMLKKKGEEHEGN